MNRIRSGAIVCAIVGATSMLGAVSAARAQGVEQGEAGNSIYRTYCTSCHGPEARGNGPVAAFLKVRPADLTQIAKRNNGTFPSDRVFEIIDGRQVVKTHGASEMPIWGDAFSKSMRGGEPAAVTAKIKSLVEYLASIQEPPAK